MKFICVMQVALKFSNLALSNSLNIQSPNSRQHIFVLPAIYFMIILIFNRQITAFLIK